MTEDIKRTLDLYVQELKMLYGEALNSVILYGSYARGDYREDSDIDIMILLSMKDQAAQNTMKNLAHLTFDFNMDHNTDIMPVVKGAEHFSQWSVAYPFYSNIKREGVSLYGAA